MTRGLAVIGALTLLWLLGFAKPTVGLISMAAFAAGYATARTNNGD